MLCQKTLKKSVNKIEADLFTHECLTMQGRSLLNKQVQKKKYFKIPRT